MTPARGGARPLALLLGLTLLACESQLPVGTPGSRDSGVDPLDGAAGSDAAATDRGPSEDASLDAGRPTDTGPTGDSGWTGTAPEIFVASADRLVPAHTAGGDSPALAGDPQGWLVVWADRRDGLEELYAQHFRPDGERDGAERRLTTTPTPSLTPALCAHPGGYGLAYREGSSIQYMRLDPQGAPLGAPVSVSAQGADPTLACDTSGDVVGFLARAPGVGRRLRQANIDPAGAVRTADHDLLGLGVGSAPLGSPQASRLGTEDLVVWVERGAVHLRRQDQAGAGIARATLPLSSGARPYAPVVVASSSVAAIFWGDHQATAPGLYFALVDRSSALLRGPTLLSADARPLTLTTAYDGEGYGVIWSDAREAGADLFRIEVSRSGRPQAEERLTDAKGHALEPAVAASGDGWAVAYTDTSDRRSEVRFRRLGVEATEVRCVPGDQRACSADGQCPLGAATCAADGRWGPCGGSWPTEAERCDGIDNDCNGRVDDVGVRDSSDVQIAEADRGWVPQLAFVAERVLLAWHDYPLTAVAPRIRAGAFDRRGQAVGPLVEVVYRASLATTSLSATRRPGGLTVVGAFHDGPGDIALNRLELDPSGALTPTAPPVPNVITPYATTAVVDDGLSTFIAFGQGYYGNDGLSVAEEGGARSMVATTQAIIAGLYNDGREPQLVYWVDNQLVRWSVLTEERQILAPSSWPTWNNSGSGRTPAEVVWTGAELIVVHLESGALRLQRYSPSGEARGPSVVVDVDALPERPALVFDGRELEVFYAVSQGVRAQRFDLEGQALGPPRAVVTAGAVVTSPNAAWLGDAYGLTWSDGRNGRSDIYYATGIFGSCGQGP